MSFTRSNVPILYNYTIGSESIKRVTQVKDLGVVFTPDLMFREHIRQICRKSYKKLGFVLRQVKDFMNITTVRVLYDALVRSHMEHNSAIWAPYEIKYKVMLERVQNKFLRYIYLRMYGVYPFYPLMYPTLFILGSVGYNELRVRREFALVMYFIKLLHGKDSNSAVLQYISFNVPDGYVRKRHRPPLLHVPTARTNLLKRAHMIRCIGLVNELHRLTDLFHSPLSELAKLLLFVSAYSS